MPVVAPAQLQLVNGRKEEEEEEIDDDEETALRLAEINCSSGSQTFVGRSKKFSNKKVRLMR